MAVKLARKGGVKERIDVTVEMSSFEKAMATFDDDFGQDAIKRAVKMALRVAEDAVMRRTPVKTGDLRRNMDLYYKEVPRTKIISAAIYNDLPYAYWIEWGVRRPSSGEVQMRVRPNGYKMFREGKKEVEKKRSAIIRKIQAEIEADIP